MAPKIKLLVNAFPMANINTGIGRYLRFLYQSLEEHYGDRVEIGYFDGKKVLKAMPLGPKNLSRWSRLASLFWKLPAYPSLALRLIFHFNQERHFRKVAGTFDIYHEAAFFPFAAPTHVKTVFTITDLSLIRFPEHHPPERVMYFRLFFRRRCKRVNRFLTISAFIQKEMAGYLGIDPKNATVTYLGHDRTVLYPRQKEEIEVCLRRYRLPYQYFLFVGSGDPRKNLAIIPKALGRSGLEIPLVVVGWSGWTKKVKSKRVRFLGYMDDHDLARLYSGALALIFPSRYEGFGLPILEAMACGCPVVTTREASLPEVAGNAALYMKNPDDIKGLSDLLKELAENPLHRKQLAKKGLAQAGRFSWESAAKSTFKVFEQALQERKNAPIYSHGKLTTSNNAPPLPSPLKVVVGSQFLNIETGGAEKYICEVCSRLKSRHQMELTYLSSDGRGTPRLSATAFRFMSSGFHHAWRKEIRNALREARPHVVYTHHTVPWISDILLHAAKELNIPAVMMYHSDVTGPEWSKRILGFFYYHFFSKRSFSLCNAFLAPSNTFVASSPYLVTIKEKFISAPPGVDPVMAKGRRDLESYYLLFVGKPHLKSKGLDLLVHAFRKVRTQWPGLELFVVGHTPQNYRRIEEKGMRYVGFVAHGKALADYYASALVTVLPSIQPGESFGMILAEALMAGCPVVGPSMGGVPELVEEGQNGYLFSPGDVAELGNTIDRAMVNQKALRNHIKKNRKLYQARFDWDRTAAIVADTLRSAALCHR